jgi:hypothetical protein
VSEHYDDPAARVLRVGAVCGSVLLIAIVSVAFDQGGGSAPAPVQVAEGAPAPSRPLFDFGNHSEERQHNPAPRTNEAGYKLIGWQRTLGGMSAVHFGVFPTLEACEAAKRRNGGGARDISCARA